MALKKEPVFLSNEIEEVGKFLREIEGNLQTHNAIEMLLHNQTIIYNLLIKLEKKLCQKDTNCGQ